MHRVVIEDTFAESLRLLKSKDYRPLSIADQYELIGAHIGADFAPVVRLLNMLPVFLNGSRHGEIRRAMALSLTAARPRQQQAAQQVIATLPALLVPGQTLELIESFMLPLWNAMATAGSGSGMLPDGLVQDVTTLFDIELRLRERLRINERLREFIAADPDTAEHRLLVLGQNSLGTKPLIGAVTLSLHYMFSHHLNQPLRSLDWPTYFPASPVLCTDRIPINDAHEGTDSAEPVRRCVLHSTQFSREENDEALYGLGEHACLGRVVSNSVWSMITTCLAGLDITISSSTLALRKDARESHEDLLKMTEPFLNPLSLKVEIGP